MSKLILPRRSLYLRRGYVPIVDPRPLHPLGKMGAFSEEFDSSVLDGKWGTSGTAPASVLALSNPSWGTLSYSANGYTYMPAPSGDFIISAAMSQVGRASTNLDGLLLLDNSSNGIGLSPYYSSPDGWLLTNITAGAYGGTFLTVGSIGGTPYINNLIGHYRIIKSGTSYTAQVPTTNDGLAWSSASSSVTGPSTITRIGVGRWQNSGGGTSVTRIDWINVTQ